MVDDTFDPWAPSTGLVDSYTGTIKSARFGFDAEYNNGNTCLLLLDVKTDAAELAEKDGIDTLKLSCGDKWVPREKGASTVRDDGKAKGFNGQSAVWVFIAAAVEAGAGDAMKAKGDPFHAATYEGLTFEFERFTYLDMGGKERSRMLPVKFLGGDKGSTAPTATEDASGASSGLSEELTAKLQVLAKECDTHDAFVERAFTEVPGVAGDAAAEAAVMEASTIYEPAHS